jgi:ABC-2 type transport system permease protein
LSSQKIAKGPVSLEGNVVPSSVAQIGIITRYEMRNYFRSRRFFILLALWLIIGVLLTVLVAHFGASTLGNSELSFFSSWWGITSDFLVVFCAIFFGADAISGEFQNKTGYFLVGNPIRRSSIYIGKWFAALIASVIVVGVFTAITLANGIYYYGGAVPVEFWEALAFTFIYLISALGFAFFFSSLFKSSSFSILVSVILLLFGFSIIEELTIVFAHIEPWFLLSYGNSIISNVLNSPYPPHTATAGFDGSSVFTTYNATIPEGLTIMLVYFAVTAVLGLLLFERKEFN